MSDLQSTPLSRRLVRRLREAGVHLPGADTEYAIQRYQPSSNERSAGAWLWAIAHVRYHNDHPNVGSVFTATECARGPVELQHDRWGDISVYPRDPATSNAGDNCASEASQSALSAPDEQNLPPLEASRDAESSGAVVSELVEALRDCLGWHDFSDDLHKPIEVRAAYMRARALLKRTTGGAA